VQLTKEFGEFNQANKRRVAIPVLRLAAQPPKPQLFEDFEEFALGNPRPASVPLAQRNPAAACCTLTPAPTTPAPNATQPMPLFEIRDHSLAALTATTFSAEGIQERRHLQRMLRDQVRVLADDLLVIAEEFGNWEDSQRRIDLLAVDRQANLVVIELKRTEDGGHVELQAIRYAAMVSTMTFDQAVDAFARHA
jgi:hypothetical protein